MARELWWASLNTGSPRYADWHGILDSDRVPLKSPGSGQTRLGEEVTEVYLLDLAALDEPAKERLCDFLAKKFNATAAQARAGIEQDGMPIRAEDVTVCFDMRAFL